jgi:hypothetical protein
MEIGSVAGGTYFRDSFPDYLANSSKKRTVSAQYPAADGALHSTCDMDNRNALVRRLAIKQLNKIRRE